MYIYGGVRYTRAHHRSWREKSQEKSRLGWDLGSTETSQQIRSRTEPSRAGPSRADPGRSEPIQSGPGQAEPSRADPPSLPNFFPHRSLGSFFLKNDCFYNELYSFIHPVAGSRFGPLWHREESMAEPSRAKPSQAGPGRAEPSRDEPSRAEPSQADPSRSGPDRAKPSRAEPLPIPKLFPPP